MVRSINFIGTLITIVASSASAFVPQPTRFSQPTFGVSTTIVNELAPATTTSMNDENTAMRNIPSTATALFAQRDNLTMMPAVLDKPAVKTGGPAILDRPAVERKQTKAPIKERKTTGSDFWEVRIYNDGMNTREFVARCLVQITGLSEITAYQTMMQAHQNGLAVVGRYVYEIAEMYHNALKENGIVFDLVPVDEEK